MKSFYEGVSVNKCYGHIDKGNVARMGRGEVHTGFWWGKTDITETIWKT